MKQLKAIHSQNINFCLRLVCKATQFSVKEAENCNCSIFSVHYLHCHAINMITSCFRPFLGPLEYSQPPSSCSIFFPLLSGF